MSDTAELLLEVAQVGVVGLINALMARESTRQIIAQMVLEGRTALSVSEEHAINDESETIRARRDEAIARAKAEGR